MCLGIPGQVVEMVEGYGNQLALVDVVPGGRRRVNVGMLDDQALNPGDWILIHLGFAVERVDAAGAEQAIAGLEMMGGLNDGARVPDHLEGSDAPRPVPRALPEDEAATLGSGSLPHA